MTTKNIKPILLTNFYHILKEPDFPKDTTRVVTYITPKFDTKLFPDGIINFGLQGFLKQYLIETFNTHFFSVPEEEIIDFYSKILKHTFEHSDMFLQKIQLLHKKGYLPIQIVAQPEGIKIPNDIPIVGITNTDKDFIWLPEIIAENIKSYILPAVTAASVSNRYFNVINDWYTRTSDADNQKKASAVFDTRSINHTLPHTTEDILAGAGWCLNFNNVSSLESLHYLKTYYNASHHRHKLQGTPLSVDLSFIGEVDQFWCELSRQNIQTETDSKTDSQQVVMHNNNTKNKIQDDGPEELPLDIAVNHVCEQLRKIRTKMGLSSATNHTDNTSEETEQDVILNIRDKNYYDFLRDYLPVMLDDIMTWNGTIYLHPTGDIRNDTVLQTLFVLSDLIGCSNNKRSYKNINANIKILYDANITTNNMYEILAMIYDYGFSAENIVFGISNFNPKHMENEKFFKRKQEPIRLAMQTTYCEVGKTTPMSPASSKHIKGCVIVSKDHSKYTVTDNHTWYTALTDRHNSLIPIFANSHMTEEQSLSGIRYRLREHS